LVYLTAEAIVMTKFFAGVLSVIAVGVLLIAYGLLSQRAVAFEPSAPVLSDLSQQEGPEYGDDDRRMMYALPPAATQPAAIQTSRAVTVPAQAAELAPVRVAAPTRAVERQSGRDWKKTALVVGGSTAAAAGVGGIVGGKKGALIGAAIGGGASTLYESTRK
jgi:hypothetical protein